MKRYSRVHALSALVVVAGLAHAPVPAAATDAMAAGLEQGDGDLTGTPTAEFTDVAGNVHAQSIDQAARRGIVRGYPDGDFRPHDPVQRDQMATFLVATLETAGVDLPDPGGSDFRDVAGNTHASSIRRLARAGLVEGLTPTAYRPREAVTRAQMATLLWRGHRFITGDELRAGDSPFEDTATTVHREAIHALAEAGIVAGRGSAVYDPTGQVQRGAMATFVTNHLDVLAASGHPVRPVPTGDRDDVHATAAFPFTAGVAVVYRDDYLDGRSNGRTHRGTDVYAPAGTEIRAVTAGVVRGWQPGITHAVDPLVGGGYQVHIDTEPDREGIRRRDVYAHFGPKDPDAVELAYAPGVRPGVRVEQGELLGWLGDSGTANRPHLHFEMRWLAGPQPARDPGADFGASPGNAGAPRWNPYPTLRAAEAAGEYPLAK